MIDMIITYLDRTLDLQLNHLKYDIDQVVE